MTEKKAESEYLIDTFATIRGQMLYVAATADEIKKNLESMMFEYWDKVQYESSPEERENSSISPERQYLVDRVRTLMWALETLKKEQNRG